MPALTPRTGESLASVVPEGLDDTASSVEASPKRNSKKKYGFGKRFAYQKLRGFRPILSARAAQIFLVSAGTLLLALGIPILIASLHVRTYTVRYDDAGPLAGLDSDQQQAAIWAAPDGIKYDVQFNVDKDMKAPIYLVFELDHYYQNYRRYVRSYDPKEMHDNGSSIPGQSACAPYQWVGNAENDSLPESGAIVPCGQISHSLFNDTFTLSVGGAPVAINDSNIAWPSDQKHLYGDVMPINYNIQPEYSGGGTVLQPLNQDQHWMVWQRPSGKIPLQKLYGKIDTDIPAGANVTVAVANRYNTYAFSGAKKIILTTNSWVGGQNLFLPIAYLVVSGLCYITALAFFLGYDLGLIWKRKPGVTDDFSWVRHSRANTPVPGS